MAAEEGRQRVTSLRSGQKEFTRQRLIESALAVFESRGYEAATVDEIAVTAGASRPTFYLHFASKADVVRALSDQVKVDVASYYGRLDRVIAGGSREEFRQWLKDALSWFEEHRTIMHAYEQVEMAEDPVMANIPSEYTDYMPTFLSRWPAEQHEQARVRVWMLVLLVAGVHRSWKVLGRRSGVSEEIMVDVMEDMCAAGLRLRR
jgi:AcrR family transcriptional regulator